jgi:hydroxypyruvate reductase
MWDTVDRIGTTLNIDGSSVNLDHYDEIYVVGGGKAAAQMAAVAEDILGDWLTTGVVVTNAPAETERIEVIEGGHPIPTQNGQTGAQRILSLVDRATDETLMIYLISGGGSALLPVPIDGVSLSHLQSLTDTLLESGATIHEINAVRKHFSAIKGGRLATRAAPATGVGLILSDVVGNDLSIIASGPLVPDASTFADVQSILNRYDVTPPAAIREQLERGLMGELSDTPNSGHPAFDHIRTNILADGFTALDAARSVAEQAGYTPLILSSRVEGEARDVAKVHAAIGDEAVDTGNPVAPPAVVLSGGETTVTIRGGGEGGPNQEFVLEGALALDSEEVVIAGVDTDGNDGATDVAGGIATGRILGDPQQARTALAENDAYRYLVDMNAVIETGRTGTNVNDLRLLVIPDRKGMRRAHRN